MEAGVTSRVENESLLNDGEQHASSRPSKRHFIPLKVSSLPCLLSANSPLLSNSCVSHWCIVFVVVVTVIVVVVIVLFVVIYVSRWCIFIL